MNNIVLGIDLGTTFTVAAYIDDSGTPRVIHDKDHNPATPSAVLFKEDGSIVVGWPAMRVAVASSCFLNRNTE